MTIDKQPRALRLANDLESIFISEEITASKAKVIAAELRRMHTENEDYGATIDHLTRETAEQIGEIVALKEQRDELLEALINMVDYYGTASANVQQLDAAKSAIAKATGETK